MDNFINKYAQGKNAQEMIRANAMAEAEERERMAARLSEYDAMMQEVRQCNLHTLENAEKVKELLASSLQKIEEVQKIDENVDKVSRADIEEIKALLKEMAGKMEERLGAVEESNHKEAVKVYRNVQAVIEEALPKQAEEIKEVVRSESEAAGMPVWLSVVCVMAFLAASANVAIEVLRILGYL